MCTALTLKNNNKTLFGRNMDIETEFFQQPTFVPRNFKYTKVHNVEIIQNYAILGMAYIYKNPNNNIEYPMFADAVNEHGLAIAGLYFPDNAHWFKPNEIPNAFEVTPYELIPFILSKFKTVQEVIDFLNKTNLIIVFKQIDTKLPLPDLHYILSDKSGNSIVIEQTIDGLKYYLNPLGVLTNNPDFDYHLKHLSFFQNISNVQKKDIKWGDLSISPHGQGFGSVGIPGDWTPASRFVKVAFLKTFSSNDILNENLVSHFYHILDNVLMVKGSVKVTYPNKTIDDITLYQSCMDLNELVYIYKTYNNINLSGIRLLDHDLNSNKLITYPYDDKLKINFISRKE